MKSRILFLGIALYAIILGAKGQTTSQETVFTTDSVMYDNADRSIKFGATLTLPVTHKPCPAVIIVSGTGKQDRDGTMGGHKLFAAIATYLSARGIAVLRVDDRGTGLTTGVYETSTTGDFADDVTAGLSYLKTRKEIDPKKIGLIGHSEGGAVISIVASKSKDVAFLISIAGLASSGLDALRKQNDDLVASSKLPDYNKKRSNEINHIMFDTVYAYANSSLLGQKITATYDTWKKTDDEYFKTLNVQFDHFRFPVYSYTKTATGAWYRYFIRYDPANYLTKVKVPILALNGDRDLMVDARQNLTNWKKYPAMGGNKKVTTVTLPGVNHLFQHCKSCTVQEYAQLNETFDAEALSIIDHWIDQYFE
ncbi:alpha/beta hydrolase [Mucilaginibacter sp. PPCGB 2223]|uniref:alpha/beta hydrolase family protein n=1 Tax=Mucilaginibacter sp. PPCGB 2223 TaxID=1886027 RepID=UPI000824C28D|nr:alpha/beta hydrolase [Mucilaginibacter sp. PPCGB 2223]OCX52041.1 alpha/beta hydrolase [Mucilaginibacter sp. PPCGB 2223]